MASNFERSARCFGAALLLAACVSSRAGYQEVHAQVRDRLGFDAQGLGGDAAAREQARRLLEAPLDADRAAQVALLRSPRAALALEIIERARARAQSLGRIPNPDAELGARFGGGRSSPTLDASVTLDLTSLIVLGYQVPAGRAELAASRADALDELLALAYTARRAFFRQQAAEQTVELESNALAAADAAREATRALHQAGNTTDLDWAQREAAYLEASVKVRSAKAAASAQREQLLGVLGLAASESKVRIGGPLQSLPEHEPDWSAAERNANEHSLAIASAEQKRRAAELRHDAATVRSVLPHLGAGVGAEREENRWGTGPLVELELPLFYQGQAERASTLSDERAFSALRDQAALDVHATCRAVLERLSASRQRVLLYEQELLPMRQRVLDEALLQYNAMSMGVYQLLEMQRALTATQVAHLSALLDYWLQRTDLEQLLAGSKLATAASDGAAPSEVSQMGTGHGH